MPIHDFKCNICDKIFEKFLISQSSVNCDCGGAAEKLIGHSNFVLSGSGWYKDGYGLSGENSKE